MKYSIAAGRISVSRIKHAREKIDPQFLDTPQYCCERLSEYLGAKVILKVETINPVRSFKGRGAAYLVAQLEAGTHIVSASTGNFGQALAYCCKKAGVKLTIFSSIHANLYKVGRIRALGAQIIQQGEDFDAAKLLGKQYAQEIGVRFVEDGLDLESVEGAGTIGLELLHAPCQMDYLLAPLGNGSLFNGIAKVMKAAGAATKMVAVQAAGAPAMIESWKSGTLVSHEKVQTIADGIAVRLPIPETLADLEALADDGIVVTEESIIRGIRVFHEYAGLLAEPSAAVAMAAVLENRARFQGSTIGLIVSGSNLTAEQMNSWLC